jgi:hypothetical protein
MALGKTVLGEMALGEMAITGGSRIGLEQINVCPVWHPLSHKCYPDEIIMM